MDLRIDPEVSTTTVAGSPLTVSALLLGGIPRGGAVVVAGPDGLDDVEAVETMNLLAQHGYESVLAQPTGTHSGDEAGRAVVRHLVERLAARGWLDEQTGVIGYGGGARAAIVAASEVTYGAAISVPRDPRQLLTPGRITALRTPWLALGGLGRGGEIDGELAAYRDEVAEASVEHTCVVGYSGVAHCLHDSTDALVHQAVFDSWQRTVEWLNIHVAPRPTPLAEVWQRRQQAVPSASS